MLRRISSSNFIFSILQKLLPHFYQKFLTKSIIPNKTYFLLKFFASTISKSQVACKVVAKANMRTISTSTSQFIVLNQISPVLVLIAKPKAKNKFHFKNQTRYAIKCFLKLPNGKVEFLAKCNTHTELSVISTDQKISCLQNTLASMNLITKVSGKQNVKLLNEADGSLILMSEVKPSPIEIRASVKAYVYRPIILETLYPNVIEDWYDWPIEDIFFGHELL